MIIYNLARKLIKLSALTVVFILFFYIGQIFYRESAHDACLDTLDTWAWTIERCITDDCSKHKR